MSDENKFKRSDIIGIFLCCYLAMAFFSFVAFTNLAGGPQADGALATGFLKGIVWPYTVIEWNLKND